MSKSKETFEKVAATYTQMGDKKWATAKNNPDKGYLFQQARSNYETASKASESAKKAK